MSATSEPRTQRQRPRVLAGIAAILILLLAAGLAVWRVTAKSANKSVSLSSLHWIFYKEDLNRLYAADPGIMGKVLAGPGTYAYEQNASGNPPPAGTIPVQLFFSNASFQAAITNHAILPGVKWVADDPEFWSQTPLNEQQDPIPYMKDFTATAKAKGLKTILVPGRDLMSVPGAVCGQGPGQTISDAYISCGIPGVAAYGPVYVIQAASVETDLTSLVSLVQRAAAAARQANPNVTVIATLTTTPNGTTVSSTALTQAARAVLPYVQGFEVNTTPATDAQAISFLHALASGS